MGLRDSCSPHSVQLSDALGCMESIEIAAEHEIPHMLTDSSSTYHNMLILT